MHEPIDVNDVEIFKENPVYRLGNLFYRIGIRWEKDRATVLREPMYRGTILREYLETMNHEDDFATLGTVVRRHSQQNGYSQPRPDELVIHLRLGDLMQRGLPYGKQRRRRAHRMYDSLAQQLSASEIAVKTATIVTALHFGANVDNNRDFYSEVAVKNSFKLLRHVESQLRECGLSVGLKSTSNVDEDFAYMVTAQHFLKGESGLSDLVEGCGEDSTNVYDMETLGGGVKASVGSER